MLFTKILNFPIKTTYSSKPYSTHELENIWFQAFYQIRKERGIQDKQTKEVFYKWLHYVKKRPTPELCAEALFFCYIYWNDMNTGAKKLFAQIKKLMDDLDKIS